MKLTSEDVARWAYENGFVLIPREPKCEKCGSVAEAVHYIPSKEESRLECAVCQQWFEYL